MEADAPDILAFEKDVSNGLSLSLQCFHVSQQLQTYFCQYLTEIFPFCLPHSISIGSHEGAVIQAEEWEGSTNYTRFHSLILTSTKLFMLNSAKVHIKNRWVSEGNDWSHTEREPDYKWILVSKLKYLSETSFTCVLHNRRILSHCMQM